MIHRPHGWHPEARPRGPLFDLVGSFQKDWLMTLASVEPDSACPTLQHDAALVKAAE